MSVIGFTFGSFGDVLSILKIAYDVRALLSESKGASEEYQQLLAELDTSLRTLHLVQRITEHTCVQSSCYIQTQAVPFLFA